MLLPMHYLGRIWASLGLETELLNIRLYATHIHGIHFFIHVAGDDRKKLTNILIGNLHII